MGRLHQRSLPLARDRQQTGGVPIEDCLNGGVHPKGLCLKCAREKPTLTHASSLKPKCRFKSHGLFPYLKGT